ncbi:DNA alkylation repair protein [Pseudonocardia endophytica]|uniref:3-methyladenine DNA glycosylase AlkD n=1 Tax=Pseudonocardia endophytica TaxID=401976 RepID=A0A4R1HL12_PSEEN|nr:DNA alkylation repair protein [Pseudonocardia endophytica]TCK21683.1 3-methyladenine DNA glycosylase AlkD [Pseudonocardia endophytica]
MSAADVAEEIVARLGDVSDPDRAAGEAAYLKSARRHLGVRVPDVRRTVRLVAGEQGVAAREDVLAVATALWATGEVHERCLAAVELLVVRAGVLVADDLDAIERWLRAAGTWALVDPLAEKAAGDVVVRDPAAGPTLDRWAADPHFWIRRSALLALLGPLRDGVGDWERFRRYADSMVDEREFFVRKAIGWVLRETGKRRPELVAAWLDDHGDRVPGLVRREAVKYLP